MTPAHQPLDAARGERAASSAGEADASPAFVTRAEQRRRPLVSTADMKGAI